MATAGLSFANPLLGKVGVGEQPDPYAPYSPTSGIGAGGLGPSAADMALTGELLTRQSPFTLPEMRKPVGIAFSPTRNELYVQGTTFSADDADSALRSEALLGGPGVGLPTEGDWVSLDETAYRQYLESIRNPSLGRLASKNFGRGVDQMQALAGRGLQLAGAEELGGRIVEQQIGSDTVRGDLQKTQPYERQFTDIESGRGAIEWLVANFAQQGPNLIESIAVGGLGFLAGGAAGGTPVSAAGGALAGLLGKSAWKESVKATLAKKARGEVLDAKETELLREAAGIAGAVATSYAQNLATGASDIYGEMREQGVGPEDMNARLTALAGAPIYAAAETVTEYVAALAALRGGLRAAMPVGATRGQRAGELLRRGAVGGAVGGTLEGTTELGQEALVMGLSGQDLDSPEAVNRFINAFAAGFGVGGPLGAAANLRSNKPENLLNPGQQPEPPVGGALTVIPPAPTPPPPGPGTAVAPFYTPVTPMGAMPQGPGALAGPPTAALPQLPGPAAPVSPMGGPVMMVTPEGQAYQDQMLRQQANVPPGPQPGSQGVLNVLGGTVSAQELATRMQPPGVAPQVAVPPVAPVMDQRQGALQFAPPAPAPQAPGALGQALRRATQTQQIQQAIDQRVAQQEAQRMADLERLANVGSAQRQMDLVQPTAPPPMPTRPAGPTQPTQLPLFTRRQAPRPSRAAGLRRGERMPAPLGETPLTPAQRRAQLVMFTQEGEPSVAALKAAGVKTKVAPVAPKPRATATPGARGLRKGARVAEVNITTPEAPSAAQEGKLKQGRVEQRQQDNEGVRAGRAAGQQPSTQVSAGGAKAGGGGVAVKRGEKQEEVRPAVAAALKKGELARAGRQWGQYADPETQPKWSELSDAQKEAWRKVVIDDGKPTIAAAEEIAPPKKETPAPPKAEAAPAAAPAEDVEQTPAEFLAEEISVAETTTDTPTFKEAITTVLDYAFFVGEDTNIKKLVDQARAFLNNTQFTDAQMAAMDEAFLDAAQFIPQLEAQYKGGARKGQPKPWFSYATARGLLPSIKAKITNLPAEFRQQVDPVTNEPAPPPPKTSAQQSNSTPQALLGQLIDVLVTRVREYTKLDQPVMFYGKSYANMVELAKDLYARTDKAGREYIVRGEKLKDYFTASGEPKMLKSGGRYIISTKEVSTAEQRKLEAQQRAEAKALAAEEAEVRSAEFERDIARMEKKGFTEDAWDDPADGEFYRDNGEPLKSKVAPGRVRLLVREFISKLRMKPNTFVYANVADLKAKNPSLYRRAAAARQEGDFDTTDAVGYSFGPNVIIFTDFVRTEQQLKFVLAHETLGHFGFRGVMPSARLNEVLNSIYDRDADIRAAVDAMVSTRGMSKLEAIEEYLADNAATLDASLITRIWTALKNFLNRLGFQFQDDEARYLVGLARKYVRRGDTGNFVSARTLVAGLEAVEADSLNGRYARIESGNMGARVFAAGALNSRYGNTGGFLGAIDAFAKDAFGKSRDVPGIVARLAEYLQTLDNKARRSYGLSLIYRLLERQQQYARTLLSKYQRMTQFTHSPSIFGFGDGVTEKQKQVSGELLAHAALLRSVQATDERIKAFAPLVTVDDMGNVQVDPTVRAEIERAGTVTAEEFRNGFEVEYSDGSKTRFQYDVDENSPEWRVYLEMRAAVNESAIDLLLANYESAQSESRRVVGDLNAKRTAANVFTAEDLATIRRVSELYRDKRYAGSDVANAAVELKDKGKKDSEKLVVAFGRALFNDDVYAVWMKDPNANPSILRDLGEFQNAEYDDIRAQLASIRGKLTGSQDAKENQSFAVQKAIRDVFLFEHQSKNAEFYAKRTMLGSYVPFTRRGTEQVRLAAFDARGNPIALDENIRAALPYFQVNARSEAEAIAKELDKQFGNDNEFILRDKDGKETSVRLRAEVSRVRSTPDLTESVNFNEFVYALNRLNVNLTPDVRERIITTLTNQNARARKNLQRSGTVGWDKDVVRSVSEHLETTAHVAAKKLYQHRLDDVMLSRDNWLGDPERLRLLKEAIDDAATDGARARAQRAYDEYAYMYRYMRASAGDSTVTIDGKEMPTLGRGEDYRTDANELLNWYSSSTNISDSTEDLLSGEAGSRLKLLTVLMQLGGSVATAAINVVSVVTNALPYLSYYNPKRGFGGGYGTVKASTALWKAMSDVKNFRLADDAFLETMLRDGTYTRFGLTQDEAEFLTTQTEAGLLQAAQFNALVGTARGKVFSNKAQAAVRAWMSAFSYTEQLNRRATALAAYRLEKDRLQADGMTDQTQLIEEATEAARKAVTIAQGEYAMFNRPAMARGNILQYIFMYKQYPIITVQLLRGMPVKGQLLMLGFLLLASGLKGLPFAEDILDLVDTLAQKLGLKTASIEKELYEFFDAVAPGLAPLAMRGGLDGFIGATFSTRLGMGDLLPLTGAFKAGADPARELADFAGPVFGGISGLLGMAGNFTKYGAETVGLRDDVTSIQGILRDSPIAAVRALADGYTYLDTGMITNARGQVVSREAPYLTILARTLGFYPAIATQQNDIVRMSKDVASYAKAIKAEYVSAYVKAGNDTERRQEIISDVRQWNEDAKGTGLEITSFTRSANRAALEASRPTALRYLKSAPKQMRPETVELLRISGLEDEIR